MAESEGPWWLCVDPLNKVARPVDAVPTSDLREYLDAQAAQSASDDKAEDPQPTTIEQEPEA